MSIDRYLITGFPRGTSPIKHSVMEKLYKYLGFGMLYSISHQRCTLYCRALLYFGYIFILPNGFLVMTSSNGNIFRVTGPLCGEFTGQRWIPRTKASDAELWCPLWSGPEQTVETLVIWDAIVLIITSLQCLRECGIRATHLPIYSRVASLTQGQSYDYLSAMKAPPPPRNILVKPLLNHNKIFIWRNCINSYGRVRNGDASIHTTINIFRSGFSDMHLSNKHLY